MPDRAEHTEDPDDHPSGQNLTEGTQQNPAKLGLSRTDAGTKRQVLTTSVVIETVRMVGCSPRS